jgi:hypothetical protein
LGLTPRQTVRYSRLTVPEVDPALLDAWSDPAGAVGAGYRLVTWRGAHPPELVPLVCEALASMVDAPFDGLDYEIEPPTPALAEEHAVALAGRLDPFSALIIAPDGRAAGFTELAVYRHRPAIGGQSDTVVVAAHRGHALGKWLKAANLRAALAAYPELTWITTTNAETNPWMLAINETMGFRPHRSTITHQGPLALATARLGIRA